MISAQQFEVQFTKLAASFNTTKTDKVMRLWFEEFEECDYFGFCKTMKKLQRGDRFPTWQIFRDEYKYFASSEEKQKNAIQGCDVCRHEDSEQNGKIYYRTYDRKRNEVFDMIGCCAVCAPDMGGLQKVNPRVLHRDKLGVYRLPGALKADRLPTTIHWPEFMIQNWKEKHPSKEFQVPANPPDLRPENDPGQNVQITSVVGNPKQLVKDVFGKDDPEQEKERQKNLYKNREREYEKG